MFVEASVLRSHQCLYKVRREVGVLHADAVFAVKVPCAYNLAVRRINLRGKAVDGILQVFHRRHIAYPSVPDCNERKYANTEHGAQQPPKDMYEFLSHE